MRRLAWGGKRAVETPPARNPSPDPGKLLQRPKALRVSGWDCEWRLKGDFPLLNRVEACVFFPAARYVYLAAHHAGGRSAQLHPQACVL